MKEKYENGEGKGDGGGRERKERGIPVAWNFPLCKATYFRESVDLIE